jgi:hypothetical protein
VKSYLRIESHWMDDESLPDSSLDSFQTGEMYETYALTNELFT